MQPDYRPIIALIYVKDEDLTEIFRKMFKDVRLLGGRKIVANVISNSEYWNFFANAREAILDNLDLGLEIFTWKPNETDKMLKKIQEYNYKGFITYCSDENKYNMRKILDNLPVQMKANMLKDYCK